MRFAITITFLVATMFGSVWICRNFLRTIDQPTQQMLALAAHFNSQGINGHIYPLRHGFKHAEVVASAAFQINDFPLPIAIEQSPNENTAEAHFASVKNSPNLMYPQRNGVIVMNLPMWGDGTENMAMKVSNAFASFKN